MPQRTSGYASSVVIAAVIALALPAIAGAANEVEPNAGIHQAQGPLVKDTSYDGTTSSSGDDDWYIFYASGPGNFDVTASNINDATGNYVTYVLRDRDGDQLNSVTPGDGMIEHMPYTAPAAGEYYVNVHSSAPANKYRLRVTGAIGSGPGTKPSQATPNSSRDAATAFGPLAGDTLYGGAIDAFDEYDWFYFYTAGPGPIEIAATNVPDDTGSYAYFYLRDETGDSINYTSPGQNRIGRIAYNAPGPLKLLLEVRGSSPVNRYQFKITPASIVTGTPPPTPGPGPGTGTDPTPGAGSTPTTPTGGGQSTAAKRACTRARHSRNVVKRRLQIAERRLSHARSRAKIRRYRRQVTKYAKTLRKAEARVARACD